MAACHFSGERAGADKGGAVVDTIRRESDAIKQEGAPAGAGRPAIQAAHRLCSRPSHLPTRPGLPPPAAKIKQSNWLLGREHSVGRAGPSQSERRPQPVGRPAGFRLIDFKLIKVGGRRAGQAPSGCLRDVRKDSLLIRGGRARLAARRQSSRILSSPQAIRTRLLA
jgi:hypothetical protein